MEHLRLRVAEQVQQGTHPDQVEGAGSAPAARRAVPLVAAAADPPGARREPPRRRRAPGLTAAGHARPLGAAHQQFGAPAGPA